MSRVAFLLIVIIITLACVVPARADTITFTPDLTRNSAMIEGLVPLPKLGTVKLPKGAAVFEDGSLSITIIPEFNFDRVPVLRGPIIRTEVTTTGREGLISGVALFQDGYWFNKFAPSRTGETVSTAATSVTGLITGIAPDSLTVTDASGVAHVIPLADIKEIHSPRVFAFVVPALAPNPILPDTAWTANAPSITMQPSQSPNYVALRHDPLLASDGDWSNGRLLALGTALSLVEAAQFVPELIWPQISHGLWQHVNRQAFHSLTTPMTPNPLPLINGNTYSLPGMATH